MTISSFKHQDDITVHNNIDSKLDEMLGWFLSSTFKENGEELRKLKDVKTLVGCYKKTREYKQQADEHGTLTAIVNKLIEELLKQVEPFYASSIVNSIGIETLFKKEGKSRTVEINTNIGFGVPLKPYVEFIVEINKKETYSVKFTFQLETSANITKLTLSGSAEKGKSVNIEKLGMKIELSLLEVEFSDLISTRSQISLNKKMLLGSKSFEIHDIFLYGVGNTESNV
jgi:hypothetical protein